MEIKRKKMLVVDDILLNRMILAELFDKDYDVLQAENGQVALDYVHQYQDEIAIILLDLVMPVMDGFEVLQRLNAQGLMQHIPVILITGENDDEKALKGYALGVSDLVNKPFNPDIIEKRVSNVVALYAHQQNLEQRLREQKEQLEQQAEKLRQSNLFVIDALSTTVEFRNFESGEHIKRIRHVTRALLESVAEQYQLTAEEIEAVSNASAMHDIGKIAISDAILLKPGPLTKEEFDIMKNHTIRGCEILSSLKNTQVEEYYAYCYDICRHHHERWDGGGYPDGLKGDEISIWAQATSLADVYDALTSKRVYKDAYAHEQALEMILDGQCGVFNPALLESFLAIKEQLPTLINGASKN